MNRRILKQPAVDNQLVEFYAFILQDKVAPADRFFEIADESFKRLADNPAIGTLWNSSDRHLAGIRFYPMPSPYRAYIIYYRELQDGIEILVVDHAARGIHHIVDALLDAD
jgi:plasmid stabilization system protein ParE